jgi:glucose/arabinose dehydrogenase
MPVDCRHGNLRLIRDDRIIDSPVWTSPGEAGNALKSVTVHPDFEDNGWIYAAYGKQDGDVNSLAIGRGRFTGRSIEGFEEIFVADAWESGGNMGGRILFGPDNTLYITVGDRDRLCCIAADDPSLRLKAQDLHDHVGKTLRIRDDGGIPADNPFVGNAEAKPEIFTYGHRNGYGLSFHPETGELWQAEPRRGLLTELNIRVRDVAQSPDGYIYVATERSTGGPDADGMVLRLEPPE